MDWLRSHIQRNCKGGVHVTLSWRNATPIIAFAIVAPLAQRAFAWCIARGVITASGGGGDEPDPVAVPAGGDVVDLRSWREAA